MFFDELDEFEKEVRWIQPAPRDDDDPPVDFNISSFVDHCEDEMEMLGNTPSALAFLLDVPKAVRGAALHKVWRMKGVVRKVRSSG